MADVVTMVIDPKFSIGQTMCSYNDVVYQIKVVREATSKGTRYRVMRVNADGKCFGPYRNLFDSNIKAIVESGGWRHEHHPHNIHHSDLPALFRTG
jgi:hypothetical protein